MTSKSFPLQSFPLPGSPSFTPTNWRIARLQHHGVNSFPAPLTRPFCSVCLRRGSTARPPGRRAGRTAASLKAWVSLQSARIIITSSTSNPARILLRLKFWPHRTLARGGALRGWTQNRTRDISRRALSREPALNRSAVGYLHWPLLQNWWAKPHTHTGGDDSSDGLSCRLTSPAPHGSNLDLITEKSETTDSIHHTGVGGPSVISGLLAVIFREKEQNGIDPDRDRTSDQEWLMLLWIWQKICFFVVLFFLKNRRCNIRNCELIESH